MQSSDVRFKCPECNHEYLGVVSTYSVTEMQILNTADSEVWHDEVSSKKEKLSGPIYKCERCEYTLPYNTWEELTEYLAQHGMTKSTLYRRNKCHQKLNQ